MQSSSATLALAHGRRRGSRREFVGLNRGPELRVWLLAASLACTALAGVAKTDRVQASETTPGIDRSQLVLELLFEGNVADTSAAKRICTPRSAVTFVEGSHGKCAAFDGRSWVDTGFAQKELGDEFTVECWVNPAAQQSAHADVFGNHVGEGLGFVLQQDATNTNQFLAAYGAGGGRWVMTPAVPLAAGLLRQLACFPSDPDRRASRQR